MTNIKNQLSRCQWCGEDPFYVAYHDFEWGVSIREDRALFELLTLESAQSGLSWLTVLKKRSGYRELFFDFDIIKVASIDELYVSHLLSQPNIIRNRQKIEATIVNARAILDLYQKGQNLSDFLWQFVDGEVLVNHWKLLSQVPAQTRQSKLMSAALKQAGFKFIGPTVCYSLMQSAGLVNDHLTSCYRHAELASLNQEASDGK